MKEKKIDRTEVKRLIEEHNEKDRANREATERAYGKK